MNEMTAIRLAGISFLCMSLSFVLLLLMPIVSFLSNPFSPGPWLALALIGIVVLVGNGFDILRRPARYAESELSAIRLALLFAGSVLAPLGTFVLVL